MKKKRIAPMVFTEESSGREKDYHEFYGQLEEKREPAKSAVQVLEERQKIRDKWYTLSNSVRRLNNVKKCFEKVRDDLHRTGLNKNCDLTTNCLLENALSEEVKQVKDLLMEEEARSARVPSDWLIRYFIELAKDFGKNDVSCVDFALIESKLKQGAEIGAVDRWGQSVLHEVARIWHVDVAKFFLSHGADINLPDNFGRTPLHVACAVDYPEMTEFLLEMGAKLEARTNEESQTPVHYAAQNEATASLKILLARGAKINVLDYKERTPLQLAAELDRSTTAELLLDEGAPAGVYDDSKLATLTLMIEKMPSVALKALDQFYTVSRANRKQYCYLNYLIPPIEDKTCFAKSPLHVAVEFKQYQILLHPVFQRLVEVKWQSLGMWGALFYGLMNLIMNLLWTIRLCLIPIKADETYKGDYLAVNASFDALAVFAVVCLFVSETKEFLKSTRFTERFKRWRESNIQRDLKFAHPRWPEERAYLEREIRACEDYTSSYFRDRWNFLDWLTQFLMVATIILHLFNITYHTNSTSDWFRGISSATLLSMWLRLLKYARPFRSVGLFVVMLSHVISDTLRILFLTLHIFIPFVAAFWMMFGIYNIKGYTLTHGELLYSIFQIGVVGDYGGEELERHAPVPSKLLVGAFIFLGGIVILNLFIALLSDTFQRVYDNAKATAQMQRAATIIEMENTLSSTRQRHHNEKIIRRCSPEVLYYDDDTIEEDSAMLKKMTHQIKARVEKVHDYLETQVSEKTISPDHVNLSHDTLRTNEQLTYRDHDVKYLVQALNELKADFYKTTIQTRAEIAGLGLMMKDLIDNQEKMNTKSRKKKIINDIKEKSSTYKSSSITSEEQQRVELPPLTRDFVDQRKLPTRGDSSRHGETDDDQTEHKSKANEPLPQKDESIVTRVESVEGKPPENDFYEGYTFKGSGAMNDDQIIKRTWGSIFTQMSEGNALRRIAEAASAREQKFLKFTDQNDIHPNKSFNI
ncbi:transient receptor potential channel pyrexia-like [Clytia hemisphaerica]|uniref:Ion transport domain-containing protein n=1 Tax=Clytia hemisphaerica TaxID=252671 RepID=A0A7M5UU31_9CNID